MLTRNISCEIFFYLLYFCVGNSSSQVGGFHYLNHNTCNKKNNIKITALSQTEARIPLALAVILKTAIGSAVVALHPPFLKAAVVTVQYPKGGRKTWLFNYD